MLGAGGGGHDGDHLHFLYCWPKQLAQSGISDNLANYGERTVHLLIAVIITVVCCED